MASVCFASMKSSFTSVFNILNNPVSFQKPLLDSAKSIFGPSPLLGFQAVRTNVRMHFPKPREVKRIRKHGWKARLSTISGQKIIMRRILKGRHVLSH